MNILRESQREHKSINYSPKTLIWEQEDMHVSKKNWNLWKLNLAEGRRTEENMSN